MKKLLFIILPLFLFNILSFSQKSRIVEITGKVISEKDHSPVHYATIINIKKGKTTACDSLGFFHITMLRDDILRINALGYELKYFSFKDSAINTTNIAVIKLKEKTYRISNVDIYEARWKDFEFEFIHTETEKQEIKERIEKWFYTLIDPKELALLTASTAIGIPINYKTKIDKQKIKVKELEKQETENKIIELKFNPELVSEITGLNKSETIKFMRFCMFDRQYLLETNEYDLIIEIQKKFDRYFKIIHR
ncbi:MAG: carboxypeptidase-like regulatory domain-containing protein [Bacteroidales bacterium]|nr:carboxypeptidase-like regulatory domain-containing protein [Bacteroidales bacterium]